MEVSVHIRSYSDSYFPIFGLNTERHGISLRIQSKCGKIRTRITPNTDTFYAVMETYTNESMMFKMFYLYGFVR